MLPLLAVGIAECFRTIAERSADRNVIHAGPDALHEPNNLSTAFVPAKQASNLDEK
jgi:hypothetical protein